MPTDETSPWDTAVQRRIEEALSVLKELGFPKEQQNERSALTLLAILALPPEEPWRKADSPQMGITPIMDYIREVYGKRYAPNTRETIRRQTVHQFLQAGLVVANPDAPSRPVNSPKAVYQIEPVALALLRTYHTRRWKRDLNRYLTSVETLARKYARAREMKRVPLDIGNGRVISLTPGKHSELIGKIISEFCPMFTPGGKLVYLSDTGRKWAFFDQELLASLNVEVETHGKMPDVIVYYEAKGWLVLIEAVTTHGPVDPKRREELQTLFRTSKAGLVYVTAFSTGGEWQDISQTYPGRQKSGWLMRQAI